MLRGTALVDAVMEQRRGAGEELSPCAPEELARRTLGEHAPTPALRRWWEHDDDMFTLGAPCSFSELVARELPEWREAFADAAALLPAPCVLFEGWGSDSRRFLYLGATDTAGEYPVFTLDTDDTPFICINGPLDVWLAQHAGFLEKERVYGHVPTEYLGARDEQARLNFHGIIDMADGERHTIESASLAP